MRKIRLTFKTPDVVSTAVQEEAEQLMLVYPGDLNKDEREDFLFEKKDEMFSILEKFVRQGEYCTIEIDLDDKTATVIPVR